MKKTKVIILLVMSIILTLGCLSVSAANISVENEDVVFSGLINTSSTHLITKITKI